MCGAMADKRVLELTSVIVWSLKAGNIRVEQAENEKKLLCRKGASSSLDFAESILGQTESLGQLLLAPPPGGSQSADVLSNQVARLNEASCLQGLRHIEISITSSENRYKLEGVAFRIFVTSPISQEIEIRPAFAMALNVTDDICRFARSHHDDLRLTEVTRHGSCFP